MQCQMGASGDMIMASLLELLDDKASFIKQINNIGLNDVEVTAREVMKSGIKGTHINVSIYGKNESDIYAIKNTRNHKHSNLKTIENIIENLHVSKKVKSNALQIYRTIANAEAFVHNKGADQIHFHEVGNIDAVVDIVSSCILMELISPDIILASPVNLGSGFVEF